MSAASLDYRAWAVAQRQRIELSLAQRLPLPDNAALQLHTAMRYSTLSAGKRIRALLCYSAEHTCGANSLALDAVASAVEMIHAYSLIHDDLPCMDDDVLRRGKPTCHVQFGEAIALLAADALQPLAFESIANMPVSAAQKVAILSTLARATGSAGMVAGQAIDLAAQGQTIDLAALETMHQLKTGALIKASVTMGLQCAEHCPPETYHCCEKFSHALGLAFQVIDDILDTEGNSTQLGKTAGKDRQQNKATFVTILGLDAAKAHAQRLTQEAHDALLPLTSRADALHGIADEVLLRRY